MSRTYLRPPDGLPDVAQGYQPALASAEVDDGRIAAITLASSGGGYDRAPPVRIIGGGGARAAAAPTSRRAAHRHRRSLRVTAISRPRG